MARVVAPACWHHVTQRGYRRQTVFFDDFDRRLYLGMLLRHCTRYQVALSAYCLMSNHVHLLARPSRPDGLARAIGRTHNDYARWCNLRRRETGHVWQNRFYSCPLDDAHTWEAMRYIECNPVRAGLATVAWDWPWSSASAHVGGRDETGLLDSTHWKAHWTPEAWREVLEKGVADAAMEMRIRDATQTGRPLGGDAFVQDMEQAAGRQPTPRKRGPKPKATPGPEPLNFGIS